MPNIISTAIELDRVKIYAHHGVMEQELAVGNIFEVTLRVNYPFIAAMETDDLNDTISYATLYDIIKAEMSTPSKLIEHVAGRIIKSICAEFPEITGGYIRLTKPNPPITGEMIGASVEVIW